MGYLIPKIRKKFNRFYIPKARKLNDLVVFFLLTFGLFLPVRWFFYGYVTHHVVPNMGMVTFIAIVVFLLIRSGKLGFIGDAFNRQMVRFAASKTFKRVLIFSLALSLYTGVPLVFMERGEFVYQDELQIFDANSIRSAYLQEYVINNTEPIGSGTEYMPISQFCDIKPKECVIDPDKIKLEDFKDVMLNKVLPSPEIINHVNTMTLMESYNFNIKMANDYDFLFSVAMHLANVQSNGWSGHFSTVWFVEEVEAVGLFFLYRRWYLKKSVGVPWLGVFDINIKRIMYKTEKDDRFYRGRSTKPEEKRPIFIALMLVFTGILLKVLSMNINNDFLGWVSLLIIGCAGLYLFLRIRKKKK